MSVATVGSIGDALNRRLTASANRAVTRREIAWGVTLAAVLVAGVIATLLLRTAMQTEAHAFDLQRSKAAALQVEEQQLSRQLDQISNPASLAQQARALSMRPDRRPKFITPRHR